MERIELVILLIRGHKVILSTELANLYQVEPRSLIQVVKRNLNRFPDDFMFQLSESEKTEVVANCDHLARLKFSPQRPYAFTEHGALNPVTNPPGTKTSLSGPPRLCVSAVKNSCPLVFIRGLSSEVFRK
jgi:hypothetical protein